MCGFELFEWVGLLATIGAGWIFFAYAGALDELAHKPAYHWDVVWMITGIYLQYIPKALAFAAVCLVAAGFWLKWRRSHVIPMVLFGLRIFFAYCLLLIAFRIINFYVPVIHPGIRDFAIQRIDQSLFFGKDAAVWLQYISVTWLTHILTGAYVAWFSLLFATILVLLIKSRAAASRYVLASLTAFYIGYVCYVLVPVIGPGYTMHFAVPIGDIAPQFTLDRLFVARDCFPSLHTAMSVVMVIYIARYNRRWLWLYGPMACLIVFATLYLRFHYALDDIAGAALGLAVSFMTPGWYDRWERFRERTRAAYSPNGSV